MSKKTRGNLLLLLTSLIWGCAFAAQRAGSEYVGPFTYNTCRNVLGFLILIPVILIFSEGGFSHFDRVTVTGGIVCGIVLAIAGGCQQTGIMTTTAGKAGFITALYIIIVPLIGSLFGRRVKKLIWLCVLLAICGFWFLCVNGDYSVNRGDFVVLMCALGFAVHILVIDFFMAKGADGVKMSWIQFLIAGILSFAVAKPLEAPSMDAIMKSAVPILYAGVMSSGVGFTLQIIAQKDTEPTTASLIMSLESVFAALAGWLILHESFSVKEFIGCVLVFAAVILAQIPGKGEKDNV